MRRRGFVVQSLAITATFCTMLIVAPITSWPPYLWPLGPERLAVTSIQSQQQQRQQQHEYGIESVMPSRTPLDLAAQSQQPQHDNIIIAARSVTSSRAPNVVQSSTVARIVPASRTPPQELATALPQRDPTLTTAGARASAIRHPHSCAGVLPLRGRWDPALPPYFHPDTDVCAPPPLLTPTSLLRCLDRRGRGTRPAQLFFAGNSFARGEAFVLASWLTGAEIVTRTAQKDMCERGKDKIHESCSLPVTSNLTIKFMWRDAWDSSIALRRDFCFNTSVTECHSRFFGASEEGDIFFSNIARGYMEWLISRGQRCDDVALDGYVLRDFDAFSRSRVFAGDVVWQTMTHVSGNFCEHERISLSHVSGNFCENERTSLSQLRSKHCCSD